MLISVVVPAFNEEKILSKTLEQIQFAIDEKQNQNFTWEVIVCDNNSTDSTAEVASRQGAKVAFEPINHISRARNTGAALATGNWLLFIDADSFPTPELIADVLDVIDRGNCIGCGSTIVVEDGTLFNKLRMERLNPLFLFFNICGGAFILCERKAFETIGGFSTNLYAYEDVDFVLRLKWFGRKKIKKFIVLHRHPVITSGRKGDYSFWSIAIVCASNFAAVVLFIFHYILPKKLTAKFGSKLLGYWYNDRK